MKYNILDFIPYGKENAISQEELAIRMQCDRRTVRASVFSARRNGAVICSTCEGEPTAGYYRPLSTAEALPYVKMQRSRIESAKEALKSAEEYISDAEQGLYFDTTRNITVFFKCKAEWFSAVCGELSCLR